MPHYHVEVVDEINALRDLVMVIADSLDRGDSIDSIEAGRMAYVLVKFVCGGLDKCDEMLEVKEEEPEDQEEEEEPEDQEEEEEPEDQEEEENENRKKRNPKN